MAEDAAFRGVAHYKEYTYERDEWDWTTSPRRVKGQVRVVVPATTFYTKVYGLAGSAKAALTNKGVANDPNVIDFYIEKASDWERVT